MIDFENKVVLVTGGGSGIGQACCIAFSNRGAKVVVSDLDEQGGQATVDQISDLGGEAMFVRTNVSDPTDVQSMVAQVVEKYGKLDIAVNNAGIGDTTPVAEKEIDEWLKVINVNLNGVFYCVKFELQEMLKMVKGLL